MNPKNKSTSGVILQVTPSGDNKLNLLLLSTEGAFLPLIARISPKKVQLSLLDIVELELTQSKMGELFFVQEYRITGNHTQLAKHYQAFLWATRWVKLLIMNRTILDLSAHEYQLTLQFLNSLADSPHPECSYFKMLYAFLKSSGFPVKEDWFIVLDSKLQEQVQHVISTPVLALQHMDSLPELVDFLEQWVHQELGMKLP